jgi:hypothetical protein
MKRIEQQETTMGDVVPGSNPRTSDLSPVAETGARKKKERRHAVDALASRADEGRG